MTLDLTKTKMAEDAEVELVWLASPQQLDAFLVDWHTCKLPPAEFNHAAHVAVASQAVYHSPEAALDLLRPAIRHFNVAVGGENTETAGYHETLTRFWTIIVTRVLATAAPPTSFDAARAAVHALGHRRDLVRDYYSYDVVPSREARLAWVAPDLAGPYGPIF